MEEVIVLIVLFSIAFLVVGGTLVMALKEHMKTTKGVINHNDRLTKFVYKIPMKKEEIIEALRSAKDTSELRCEVDPAVSQLVFDGVNGRRRRNYAYAIREEKGFCYFYIKELYTPFQGHVEYKINSFMIANLQAELIPYSEDTFELD
ncbi:MAG: hypothetical protein IJZ33_04915 [Clostridia bacterium]|nr:hypothetical protein [Clostridia bacterium]